MLNLEKNSDGQEKKEEKKQTDPVALHGEETGTLIPDWRGPTADQRRK